MIEDCDEALAIWIDNSSVIANTLELLKELDKPTFLYEYSHSTNIERSGMFDPRRTYHRPNSRKKDLKKPRLTEYI